MDKVIDAREVTRYFGRQRAVDDRVTLSFDRLRDTREDVVVAGIGPGRQCIHRWHHRP